MNDTQRCPKTGRPYEVGFGALPHEQQTANYVREAADAADMPKQGERCPKTGREFERGSGAQTRTRQTERFLNELSPTEKARCIAAFDAKATMPPAGNA